MSEFLISKPAVDDDSSEFDWGIGDSNDEMVDKVLVTRRNGVKSTESHKMRSPVKGRC